MIVVTGATGQLGRLVIDHLLKTQAPDTIVAAVRSPEKAKDLADHGVIVREADYDRPEALGPALTGADKLLLISSSEVGKRAQQHKAVVQAAVDAQVKLVAYTSILRADTSTISLAPEHKATEETLRGAGLPYVFLRNGGYIENYTGNLAPALEHGVFIGAAQDGKIAAATRDDFAAAAAAVLTTEGHANKVYELVGDTPFTMTELAAAVFRWAGRDIGYQDMRQDAYEQALAGAGLPPPFAAMLADADARIAEGELFSDSQDLHRLIGRKTTTLDEALASVPKPS